MMMTIEIPMLKKKMMMRMRNLIPMTRRSAVERRAERRSAPSTRCTKSTRSTRSYLLSTAPMPRGPPVVMRTALSQFLSHNE